MTTRTSPKAQQQISHVGRSIRAAREQAGLTLDELAATSGLSRSYLSRVERGHRQASLAALLDIANALATTVSALVSTGARKPPRTVTNNGVTIETLSEGTDNGLQAFRLTIPARRPAGTYVTHPGQEYMYVLNGTLFLEVADQVRILPEGGSSTFDTTLPHRASAVGDTDATILLVATQPPSLTSRRTTR